MREQRPRSQRSWPASCQAKGSHLLSLAKAAEAPVLDRPHRLAIPYSPLIAGDGCGSSHA